MGRKPLYFSIRLIGYEHCSTIRWDFILWAVASTIKMVKNGIKMVVNIVSTLLCLTWWSFSLWNCKYWVFFTLYKLWSWEEGCETFDTYEFTPRTSCEIEDYFTSSLFLTTFHSVCLWFILYCGFFLADIYNFASLLWSVKMF